MTISIQLGFYLLSDWCLKYELTIPDCYLPGTSILNKISTY